MSKLTKVVYVGRHGAVDVALPTGGFTTVQWDQPFETTAEHAAQLLEQESNWKPAPGGKAKAAITAAEEE